MAEETGSRSPHPKSLWLFWHDDGERYVNVASGFAAITRRLASEEGDNGEVLRPWFRKFRFHDLRHLFAVEALRSGTGIYALQQILGHRSIRTTELYFDYLTPEEAQRARTATDTPHRHS